MAQTQIGEASHCRHRPEATARPVKPTPVAPTGALPPQQALWFELMQFYIREAWLLDERKLKEWLDLFTDDVLYFMPRRKNVPRRELHRELTPLGDLAILEEDKRYLEMRVARLDTGMAWAEDPPSRTRHLIGNLEATPLENGEIGRRPRSWSTARTWRPIISSSPAAARMCCAASTAPGRSPGAQSSSTPTSSSTKTSACFFRVKTQPA